MGIFLLKHLVWFKWIDWGSKPHQNPNQGGDEPDGLGGLTFHLVTPKTLLSSTFHPLSSIYMVQSWLISFGHWSWSQSILVSMSCYSVHWLLVHSWPCLSKQSKPIVLQSSWRSFLLIHGWCFIQALSLFHQVITSFINHVNVFISFLFKIKHTCTKTKPILETNFNPFLIHFKPF